MYNPRYPHLSIRIRECTVAIRNQVRNQSVSVTRHTVRALRSSISMENPAYSTQLISGSPDSNLESSTSFRKIISTILFNVLSIHQNSFPVIGFFDLLH